VDKNKTRGTYNKEISKRLHRALDAKINYVNTNCGKKSI